MVVPLDQLLPAETLRFLFIPCQVRVFLRDLVISPPDQCIPYGSLVFGWGPGLSKGAGGAELPGLCRVTGLFLLLFSRWLWLMPNPTTACFLRETERIIIIAC